MTNTPAIIQPAAAIDFERLADAIKREENSRSHPYGVMVDGLSEAEARAWCIRICRLAHSAWLRDAKNISQDYFRYLAFCYKPENQPLWSANVRAIYNQP
jgi:hypothetical protein